MTALKTAILTSLTLLLLAACATSRQNPPAAADGPGKALYDAGRAALMDQDYQRAMDRFRTLMALHPDTPYTPQARMELAYSYYKTGDALSAIATAERFIRDYPRHPTIDYLYYLRGLAAYDQSIAALEEAASGETAAPPLTQLAEDYFKTLIERFPNSKYSADARTRLAHLQEALARREIQQAKNALASGDYAKAALHAQAVAARYPDSPLGLEAAALADMASRSLQPTARALARLTPDTEKTAPPPVAHQPPPPASGDKASGPDGAPAAAADGALHDGDWLLAQAANTYTIQLLGTSQRDALLAFAAQHELNGEAAHFTVARDGRPWHTLVYGIYPDRAAARAAAARLPAELRAQHPWIRSLGSIHAAIRASHP